jgi:hypothetical protein
MRLALRVQETHWLAALLELALLLIRLLVRLRSHWHSWGKKCHQQHGIVLLQLG